MIQSIDARSGTPVEDVAVETSHAELDRVVKSAVSASSVLKQLGRRGRSAMLVAMAEALEERRHDIVALADRESALGEPRLAGELTRTCYQLRFFADVITDGAYLEPVIDHAGGTPMGSRPDLRRLLQPLGPVAVFGASNFPLAFSVPGGDTASALAAGCPVVAKVHDAHPATSRACAAALAAGAERSGAPGSVISLVFGEAAGSALVTHEAIKAVGFTGSVSGGRHLAELASRRPSPIPFFGELGALNAVVVAPKAAEARADHIADGLVASFTLGVGQFCTKPGLVFIPADDGGDRLRSALSRAVRELPSGAMLTQRIAENYAGDSAFLRDVAGVRAVAEGGRGDGPGWSGTPLLLEADGAALDGALKRECFGPVLVVVCYEDFATLRSLAARLLPALTVTIHAEPEDAALAGPLLEDFSERVGRIIWNGFPTGVAVSWAMHHGGPYPATTNPLHTSVGATAIRRWLRPVTYQDVPEVFLPPEVTDTPAPAHLVARRVDGVLRLPAQPGTL